MEIVTKPQNGRLISLCGFIIMVLIWGSFPVAAKLGIARFPPLLFSALRFFLAALVMALLTRLQRKPLWIAAPHHRQIFVISTVMVGIPASIFFAAAPYASVGILTLMWSTTPIFTALFNARSADEVRGWRLLMSLAIGAVGIIIVLLGRIPFWPDAQTGLVFAGSGATLVGELAVLASAVVYGLGMYLAKRSSPDVPVITFTTWQLFYSGTFIFLLNLIFERGYVFQPTWQTWGILLYVSIVCSCAGFFLMFWLIRRIGAIRTAYGDFLIPGVTLVLSYILLGEAFTLAKIGGFVLVVLGCFLIEH